MTKRRILLFLIGLMLMLAISACSLSLAQDVTPPPGYTPPTYQEPALLSGKFPLAAPDLEAGEAIYQEKCLPCHGETGLGDGNQSTGLPVEVAAIGQAAVANLSSPLKWFSIVYDGKLDTFMPPFSGSLDDAAIWNVLGYIYTFSAPGETLAQGETLFNNICSECHGVNGDNAPGAADLTNAEEMVQLSISDIVQKVETGNGDQNHVFGSLLSPDEQEAVAYFVSSLTLGFSAGGESVAAAPTAEPTLMPTEAPATPEPATTEAPTAEAISGELAPTEGATTETVVVEATPTVEGTPVVEESAVTKGIVTGTVTNGSGGPLPDGLEVSLQIYSHFDLVSEQTAALAEDGSFEFSDVEIVPDQIYLATVDHEGMFFPSEFYIAVEGDSGMDLPVVIYDITDDTSSLVITRLHVFFDFQTAGIVQVVHMVSIANRGDKMVAPQRDIEPVLNFSLPEGATNLIFEQGSINDPYVLTSEGFGDPSSVIPGEESYQILFAYDMPFDRALDWTLPLDLPVDVAVVFVQGEQMDLSSDLLVPSGVETLNEDIYQVLVANGLNADQELNVNISGNPANATGSGLPVSNNTFSIAIGVAGLVLAGLGAWRLFRPSREEQFEDDEEDSSEIFIQQIIDLDEAFEAGEIDEESYLSQREALKTALQEALGEQEDDED